MVSTRPVSTATLEHLDVIFAIAERHGCGIDLHLHDRGALGRWELGLMVERTRVLGRDLWSPWGDADMLARAGLMAWRSGHRRDEDIARCVDIATSQGPAAIGVGDHGLIPGGRGDLVLVDAATPAEAAVTHPPRLSVVKSGKIVRAAASDRQRS